MRKRIISAILALLIILSSCIMANAAEVELEDTGATVELAETGSSLYGLCDNVQDGQILQCWCWSYNNIKANMQKIAQQGFTAVQTSPIQATKESTLEYYSTFYNSSWVYYQPVAFNIETNSFNALGTKSEFESMCAEAEKYGIKVIVDTVFNHMANDMTENTIHSWIPSEIKDNTDCWHDISKNCSNYSDRYDITHYCLSGLPDLNTANSTVQSHCINFLKECIDAGADGFRFDAAKHIETPWDADGTKSDFWTNVLGEATSYAQSTYGTTPYYYGELLDDPGDGNIGAYTNFMSVTDNQGSNSIRQAICDGNASGAANSGIFNGAAPSKTVQWTESHDTYKDSGTRYISDHNINKTWAIVGTRAEVCGQYMARPSDIESTMLGAADTTSWAYPEVKAINQFKNHFVGQSEYFSSYNNLACVERGSSGMVIVNVGGTYYNGMSAPVHTMSSGTYTDAITGNTFTVADGYITGDIGDTGIAVVYDVASSGPLTKGNVTELAIAGTFNDWDTSANKMVANDSNTASTTMFLYAGTYTFKVTTGDIWYGNSGTIEDTTTATSSSGWSMDSNVSDNCTLVASGGKYTFTFNPSTGKLIIEYEDTTDKTSSIYLKGAFNSWDTSNPMTYVDGTNSVTTTLDLTAGSYTFKLNNADTGVWYGKDSTITDTTTTTSDVGWTMYTDQGNCTLEASGGTYVFTFNLSTQKLIIEYNNGSETTTTAPAEETDPVVTTYTVTFADYDGTVLSTQTVESGGSATAPADPVRAADAQYTYTFAGWDTDYTNITANTTVTATYTTTVNKYTVTFVDYDGTTLSTQSVEYGSAATAPADPTRDGYTFTGWDVAFDNITADTTVTALYSDSSVYLRGSFNEWALDLPMSLKSGTSYTTTLDLETGSYTFKLYYGENWYGNTGTIVDTTTTTSSTGWSMTTSTDNCTLEASGGTYTFNFDISTNKLIILYTAPSYTVTFVDYDGAVLSTQSVEKGSAATAPADPAREATAQYTYTFAGWDTDFSNITADTTVTATYTETVNEYTVTFVDYDGTTLSTQSVEYGSAATAPAAPAREATAQYAYTFAGWDTDFSNITADTTVTATYTETVNKYTVTFVDYDGTILSTQSVEYGSAATAPADPTRDGYVFTGWDKAFTAITADTTVTATYTEESAVIYTVTFVDYDGTVLKTEEVAHGGSATPPLDPLRSSTTSGWTTTYYIFDGWDTDYTNITADTTVTATYTTEDSTWLNRVYYYFVYFKDYDGTILKQQNVKSGSTVTPPADPERAGYTFTGWDNTNFTITAETTFTATYSENVDSFTVTFVDYDGTVISTQTVAAGGSATAPADPTREATAKYTYTFAGWDTDFSNITADTTVTATYTETVNKYKVTFVDYDGTVLSTQDVDYGSAATAPADPVREGDAQNSYTFTGWDADYSNVTSDTTVTATYSSTGNTYTVTFVDYDSTVLSTQDVEYGSAATAPADPTRDGYTFAGWDVAFDNITYDTTVTAQYTKNAVSVTTGKLQIDVTGGTGFTISVNGGANRPQGPAYKNTKMAIGASVTVVANSSTGNTFTGWMNESGAIVSTVETYTFTTSGNDYLKAVYEASIDGVNLVTFKNAKATGGNGQILDMQYYAAGDEIVFPDAPSQAGYTFTGWSMTTDEIQTELIAGNDVTVTAVFELAIVKVTVTVTNGTVNGATSAEVNAFNATTVIADTAADGEKFAYWTDANGKVVSYDAEYKFYPAADTALTANYVATDAEVEYEPIVMIAADPTTEGEKITYVLSWDIKEEIGTVTSAGMMIVNKNDYNADTFYHNTTDTKVFDKALSSAQIMQKNTYTIAKSASYYDNTYIACTWLIYTDAVTGESVTVYSDAVEVTKLG